MNNGAPNKPLEHTVRNKEEGEKNAQVPPEFAITPKRTEEIALQALVVQW